MSLKIYNTFTRKLETFKPIKANEVNMYSCGPTVYWYQHIGNLRTYVFSDILKRTLLYDGFKVNHVMNVTDVGHLTSDADEGEDKIEKAAAKEGKRAGDLANYYLAVFKEDFKRLNILEPNIWCKATDHIKDQIGLIKNLEEKGYTYRTADGIYYDTSKFKNYGKLAMLKKEGMQAGKRVELKEKKNITDFALWKFSEKPGLRQQEWPSLFGLGFPGWHIECSAMSMKYLGEHFDIHTGGEDHIPIHHTNEIAQSEAATGKKFVNYWLHGSFLTFKGKKVSKSKGGLYTISELQDQGYKPLSYRYLCLTAHYKTQLEFSLENLKNAQNSYERLKNIISSSKNDGKENKKYLKDFEKAINNDLNMPKALAVLWELVRNEKAKGKIRTLEKIDKILGLDLLEKESISIPDNIQELINRREQARKEKNFKLADELRQKINEMGFALEDSKEGIKVKKI